MGLKKILGLPEPMECPHCKSPMEITRTLKAKMKAAAILTGGAAAAIAAPIVAPLAGVAAVEGAARYVFNKKGVLHRCKECGFRYSEEIVDKAIEQSRSQHLKEQQ